MRKLTLAALSLLITLTCFADKGDKKKEKVVIDSAELAMQFYADSVASAMKYETGQVTLTGCNAVLNIAPGFKFLNATQSQYVLHKVWGNPERTDVLGMIFPAGNSPFTDSSYAFIVTYEDMGYVKDNDAKTVDYAKMVADMHEDEPKVNLERTKQGYPTIHMVGWAAQPYYDENNKVLHWAKELKFGSEESNTLNYEVRVLGRKGVLSLEAIADMHELPLVEKDIKGVLAMASFTPGNKYSDYNSSTDKIAEYTVGGLVAGAVLTKVGFWAILLKGLKFIIMGVVAAFYGIRKWLTGKGRKGEELTPAPVTENTDNVA